MNNILFINACMRKESRTLVLAKNIIERMDGHVTELVLEKESIPPLNCKLLEKRENLLKSKQDDAMFNYAKQFAEADEIAIAAPFWDLAFPSMLKIYLEQITVAGITFEYRNGRPIGLCKAKRLVYITTSGGEIIHDFGYTYVKSLAKNFYGIKETKSYRAMNLDVKEIKPESFLSEAIISVVD